MRSSSVLAFPRTGAAFGHIEHHHFERNHQGKGNLLLFPSPGVPLSPKGSTVRCRDRLGGLLKFYSRVA